MSIDTFGKCFVCGLGEMIKPQPVHSYDFNTDGQLINYCNHSKCGITSDSYENTKKIEKILNEKFSNGNLKKFVRSIWLFCNDKKNFDYKIRDTLYAYLRNKKDESIYDFDQNIYLFTIHKCKDLGIMLDNEFVLNSICKILT